MRKVFHFLNFIFLVLFVFSSAHGNSLPNDEAMQELRPQAGTRLKLYDRIFPDTAESANQTHQKYSDPVILADVRKRLSRVQASGNPTDIFSLEEWIQFDKNRAELRQLEDSFFERWYLKSSMDVAVKVQKWITKKNSAEPQKQRRDLVIAGLKKMASRNPLYSHWYQTLPSEWTAQEGIETWGELLIEFNKNRVFRESWVERYPESLSFLKELSQIWAWEDSSVRFVTVKNSHSTSEYWVLQRQQRMGVPNRFQLILDGDFEKLVGLEYASTLFFNRVSRIVTNGQSITYYLEAIEKGRTMELSGQTNENGVNKQTFRGAELLRKSKSDEFLQKSYVQRGSLNLFLGLRTLQLNQIQELVRWYPELALSVGQFGLSITGGRAQTVSNRTDRPEEQRLKMTATLIDLIEFAQTKNVKSWFQDNTKHVLRTILGGVGSGGAQALKDPADNKPVLSRLQCKSLFSLPF